MITTLKWIFRLCWIGICALAMLQQTRLLLGMPLQPDWLDGYVLGSTIFAYGFTHPNRRIKGAAWLAGLFGGVCFLWPAVEARHLVSWQMLSVVPLLLWLLYYGMQRPGRAGLRGMPVAKPVVVGLTWATVTVWLPLPPESWADGSFVFIGRALFIGALALAYDLSDLAYDRRRSFTTLAARIGPEKTFRLIDLVLLAAALCYVVNTFLRIFSPAYTLALIASLALSTWWLRYLMRATMRKDWQKILIDALMPIQFLMAAAAEML